MENDAPIPNGFEETLRAMIHARKQGNFEQKEAAMLSLFSIVSQEAKADRSPEMLESQRAQLCLEKYDYAGAEAAFRECLALTAAKGPLDRCLHSLSELCLLLILLRRQADALSQAEMALQISRETDIEVVRWMALDRWLRCAIAAAKTDGTVEIATQAVEIVAQVAPGETPWACALLRRAQCSVAEGDSWSAEADLNACRAVLVDSKQGTVLPGLRRYMATWWETLAECASLKGEHSEALEALERALEIRRALSADYGDASVHELDAMARCLKRYSHALAPLGRDSDSAEAEAEAARIWARLRLQDS